MLAGLLINFAGLVGGSIFVVASMRATTAVLVSQVKSLHYAMDRMNANTTALDNKIDGHAERLAKLETVAAGSILCRAATPDE